MAELLHATKELGFSSRDPSAPKIDGRTLRRTGRDVQMRLLVQSYVKKEMLKFTKKGGFDPMGQFQEELLKLYKEVNNLD